MTDRIRKPLLLATVTMAAAALRAQDIWSGITKTADNTWAKIATDLQKRETNRAKSMKLKRSKGRQSR